MRVAIRRIHRVLSAWLVVAVVLSAPVLVPARAGNWIRSLGGADVDRLHAVAAVDGRLFFAGSKDGVFGFSRAWWVETDASGAVVSETVFEDPAGRAAEFVALAPIDASLSAGPAFFAGGNVGSPATSHDVFVARVRGDGSIDWQVELTMEGDQRLGDLVALKDGGALAVGGTLSPKATKRDGWVVRLDGSGSIVWQKSFASIGDDAFASALETNKGDLVLAGQVGIRRSVDGFQGWIVALDGDGNVRWQNGFDISAGDGFASILQRRGGYLALGASLQLAFFQGDAWMVEVDRGGALESSSQVGDFEFLGNDTFVDAVTVKGGGFVAVGSTDTIAGPSSQMFAVEFDRRGVLQWIRHFGDDGFEQARAIAATGDGDVVVAGTVTGQPSISDARILRTTPGGGASPTCPFTGVPPAGTAALDPVVLPPIVEESTTGAVSVPGSLFATSTPTSSTEVCDF